MPDLDTLPIERLTIALRKSYHDVYFKVPFSITSLILGTAAPNEGFSTLAYKQFINYIFTNRLLFNDNTKTFSTRNNRYEQIEGEFQQPDIGTYTGNMHNLTETQIDNLSSGLDCTGTGINTPWTDKEKCWILQNINISSTNNIKRYKWTFTI